MNIEQEIQHFKIELLRRMPFYGDIVMRLAFCESKAVATAATDGKTVFYNPKFMKKLAPGERNFVLMHEILHVLLRHGSRTHEKRDRYVWNVACDLIINNMLVKLMQNMRAVGIAFDKPEFGLFDPSLKGEQTAENLYEIIMLDNPQKFNGWLYIRRWYPSASETENAVNKSDILTDPNPRRVWISADILPSALSPEEEQFADITINEIIKLSGIKNRGTMGSCFIPKDIYQLTQSKKLDWKQLLKAFLSEEIGEDSSYTTPERKYLHMDLILPGHSLTEEQLETVWAFVDSSGSIGKNEMNQFLTQLYRISKQFKCAINICYWDTSVTDVYKDIRKESEILKCVPRHRGGTDINCVYKWIKENKVRPDVMLILTDGYFGRLTTPAFKREYGRKTILVLSTGIQINDDMLKIGKIARL